MLDISDINSQVKEFSSKNHGSSELYKEHIFVKGGEKEGFIPLKSLVKKCEEIDSEKDLQKIGYIFESYDFHQSDTFSSWFEENFSRFIT